MYQGQLVAWGHLTCRHYGVHKGLPETGDIRDPGTSNTQRRIKGMLNIWDLVASRLLEGIEDLGTLRGLGQHPLPGTFRVQGVLLVPCWELRTQHHPGFRGHPVPGENSAVEWNLTGHLGHGAIWDLGVHPGAEGTPCSQQHPIACNIPHQEHPMVGAAASCCLLLTAGNTEDTVSLGPSRTSPTSPTLRAHLCAWLNP